MAASVPFSGEVIVRVDPTSLAAFMRGPGGPIVRKLAIIGETLKVRTIASLKTGFPRDYLGPQIVKRVSMTEQGPIVYVGAVNLKTKPHPIVGNPRLVFFWAKVGRVVSFPRVNHPGSDFSRYVSIKLLEQLALLRGAF